MASRCLSNVWLQAVSLRWQLKLTNDCIHTRLLYPNQNFPGLTYPQRNFSLCWPLRQAVVSESQSVIVKDDLEAAVLDILGGNVADEALPPPESATAAVEPPNVAADLPSPASPDIVTAVKSQMDISSTDFVLPPVTPDPAVIPLVPSPDPASLLSSTPIDPSLIPLPPLPPIALPNQALDLPFAELGLNSWWPSGWLQWIMEMAHVNLEIPWWGSITMLAFALRILTFPVFVMQERTKVEFATLTPEMTRISEKIQKAKSSGDWVKIMKANQEMTIFQRRTGYSGSKLMKPQLIQAPIFISCMMGLRGMVNLPVESMKEGGLFWFVNLTTSDPYYLLPLINVLSIMIQTQLGIGEFALQSASKTQIWITRALPCILFPFLAFQSSAFALYWTFSIWITFFIKSILNIKSVRNYFKIPDHPPFDPKAQEKTDIKKSIKRFWNELKSKDHSITAIDKKDEAIWREAGMKAPRKTFKYDPTKVRQT